MEARERKKGPIKKRTRTKVKIQKKAAGIGNQVIGKKWDESGSKEQCSTER